MEKFESNNVSEIKEADYASKLLSVAQTDQEARKHWEETGEIWDRFMDEKNTAYLKEIIKKIGWPSKSKVGIDAATAAWLLVQHADYDPEFQQKCLELMKQETEGEVKKEDIAFLEDRVRVNQGRPILYGTQFYENDNGEFGSRPIEDKENLDNRREAMGLGSFDEYKKEMLKLNERITKREK